jgi:phosphoketolase
MPMAASWLPIGRVIEMLSEHTMEGMLEGYLLTGRHGFFSSYEAFIHVIDSMFNQHAKWLSICNHLSWRKKIASLNIFVTSTVWRQDHNGFTHQDPGFLDVVVNKSSAVTRIYMPPDINSLLSVADHCLRSENYVNVIVCDKQMHLQYMDMDSAHALHKGHRNLGPGLQRPGSGAGRGHGVCRRYSHPGDFGRDRAAAAGVSRSEDSLY